MEQTKSIHSWQTLAKSAESSRPNQHSSFVVQNSILLLRILSRFWSQDEGVRGPDRRDRGPGLVPEAAALRRPSTALLLPATVLAQRDLLAPHPEVLSNFL